jgi:hypothetical protein
MSCDDCQDRALSFIRQRADGRYVVRDVTDCRGLSAPVSSLAEAVRLWRAASQSTLRFVAVAVPGGWGSYDTELEAFAPNVTVFPLVEWGAVEGDELTIG